MEMLLKEIASIQSFIGSQRVVLSADQLKTVSQQHAESLCLKVKSLKSSQVTPDDLSKLVSLVQNGPWTQEQMNLLAVSASDALLKTSSPSSKDVRPTQSVESFFGYFTKKDHDLLASDAALVLKIDCALAS